MKKIHSLMGLLLCTLGLHAQHLQFVRGPLTARAEWDNGLYAELGFDAAGKLQGPMQIQEITRRKGRWDTVLVVQGKWHNGALVDTFFLYDADGRLLEETTFAPQANPGDEFLLGVHEGDSYPTAVPGTRQGYSQHWRSSRHSEKNYLQSRETYVANKKEGPSYTYFPNGAVAEEGIYKAGKKNGAYREWYDNAGLKSEGTYENEMLAGAWKMYYQNGVMRESHSCFGCVSDTVRRYASSGELEVLAYMSKGRLQGDWWQYQFDGIPYLYKHYDKEGRQDSIQIEYDADGKKLEYFTFRYGYRDGPAERWYPNGRPMMKGHFKEGEPEGSFTKWFSDGKVYVKGQYKDGHAVGDWLYFGKNGKSEVGDYHVQDGFVWQDGNSSDWITEDAVQDIHPQTFRYSLPTCPAFEKPYAVSKNQKLSFLKKYGEVKLLCETAPGTRTKYTLLTPLKPAEQERLMAVFNTASEFLMWQPFTLGTQRGTARVQVTLRWEP